MSNYVIAHASQAICQFPDTSQDLRALMALYTEHVTVVYNMRLDLVDEPEDSEKFVVLDELRNKKNRVLSQIWAEANRLFK